jgi:hemolysin activation/secretion protein
MAARAPIMALALATGCGLGPAAAQRQPPPIVNPVPPGSPIERLVPPTPPPVGGTLPSLSGSAQPGAVPAANVRVVSVSVEGATAYPATRLAALTAGLMGISVPLARIEEARLAILNLYRGDGYVLTLVNAALDPNGHLRFAVIEGAITEVKLEGDIGPAGTQVLRFLNHLTEVTPIDAASLERWLLLAQEIPGVSLHAVLRPTATPGALTLIAQVSRQAFSGQLSVDNRAYQLTGPQEGLFLLDGNSFTEFGEKTELSIYRTGGATQTFGQGSEQFYVGGSGLSVRLYGGAGPATPSGFLSAIGYRGFTTVGGFSLSYPVTRSRQQSLDVGFYFDLTDSTIDTNTGPFGARVRTSQDNVRALRLGADYALQDLLLGPIYPAINTASLRLSQGVTILDGSHSGSALLSRAGEQPSFTKIAAQVTRTQTLFGLANGDTVALKELLTGQYSGDILPPVEKFFLGGPTFTRGYYAGEISGDSAFAWTSELQFNTAFAPVVFGHVLPVNAQFYLYYDWGQTWNNTRTEANQHLSSEGIGVRFSVTRFTEFDLEGVVRNVRRFSGTTTEVSPLSPEAVYWQVLLRF